MNRPLPVIVHEDVPDAIINLVLLLVSGSMVAGYTSLT